MNIKAIIKEEVQSFLNEREYRDDEIVNPKETNLQEEYHKLNKQLFNNELPVIVMQWSNRKGNLGHVKSMRNNFTGEQKIMYLAISSFHAMPYRVFKDTMAHEMIHIKQISDGERGSHGYSFYKEMNKINGMNLGFNITVRSEEQLGISDTIKTNVKPLIGIILEIDGTYYISVTTPSVYNTDADFIFNLFEKLVQRGRFYNVEITVVETKNPELLKYPLKRTFRRGISYGKLSDNLLEQLLDDNIIKSAKFKKGVPSVVSEENKPTSNAGAWEEIITV
jgi:hypothetical protein